MSPLDPLLVFLFVASAIGGYRRGAFVQVIGIVGVLVGLVLGVTIGPRVAPEGAEPTTRIAIALGVVVAFAVIAETLASLAARNLRRRIAGEAVARADRIGGGVVSVTALLLVIWFVALNLASGPFPAAARGLRNSFVVRGVAAVAPSPPLLFPQLQRVANVLGFPGVFVGLPTVADPVDLPDDPLVADAVRAASGSVVQVLGEGCRRGFLNEGSGFVAATDHVVTNAHVVAGLDRVGVLVEGLGPSIEAVTVAIDPELDLAVLHVPGLGAPPLELATRTLSRGTGGAVLGFPADGGTTSVPAAVRRAFEPTGRDIYGRGEVTRRLYELEAVVRGGNSGGPFVLPDGRVGGVVFANSALDERIAYAIAASEVVPILDRAVGTTTPAPVGACTSGG